jgi:DMSO/TMAO reductase YedYZ molybdopterin-dependent catalytic subunit
MVAVAMNGEPLPVEHGFPARLVIPGLYGYVSATKSLTEIELTPVAGVAWAPTRSIERVEVRVDDRPWQRAELSGALSANIWVQWVFRWDAPAGTHQLSVRATDGDGDVQTDVIAPPAPSGATGHHTITVEVT